MPERNAVGSVVANDPFSRLMHVAMSAGSGATLELAYEQLQPPASVVASTEYGRDLSKAIAGLESQVHDLARELERAPDAFRVGAIAAEGDERRAR